MNLRRNNTRSRRPIGKREFFFKDFDNRIAKRKQKNQLSTKNQRSEKIPKPNRVKIEHYRPQKESFHQHNYLPLVKPLRKNFSHYEPPRSTLSVSDETMCGSSNGKRRKEEKLVNVDFSGDEKSSILFNSTSGSIKPKHFTGYKCHSILSKLADVKYFDVITSTSELNIFNCRVDLGVKVPVFSNSSPSDKGALNKLPNRSFNSPDTLKCINVSRKPILSKSSENLKGTKKVLHWADGEKHTKDAAVQAVPVCNVYVQTDPVEVISLPKLSLPKILTPKSKAAAKKLVQMTRCRQTRSSSKFIS